MAVSRICTCSICGKEQLAIQAELPEGWSLLFYVNYTLCKKCMSRWVERFGEEPLTLITGGESIIFDE